MVLRRFHYDLAFEHYLRQNGIPYVAVDEAKRALSGRYASGQAPAKLKSFDFVVYSEAGANLLVDVKGRKLSVRRGRAANRARTMAGNGAGNGAGGNGAGDGRTGFGGDSGNV